MKKVKIIPSVVLLSMILLMLLITSFETYSQSGNAKSLEIGNKWIYKNWSGYPGFPTEYSPNIEEVIKDTLINDKIYAVIRRGESPPYYTFYERSDSMQIYYYNTLNDSELVSINFNQRDTVLNDSSIQVDTMFYWGKMRIMVTVDSWDFGLYYNSSCYAEGIGLESKDYYSHGGFSTGSYIVAAYLRGMKFGDTTLVSVKSEDQFLKGYKLLQNYPNPFNPTTKIKYIIPNVGTTLMKFVTIKVYDVLGNEIATLVNGEIPAGIYNVDFNAKNLSSGIYFYKLYTNLIITTKKMTLVK